MDPAGDSSNSGWLNLFLGLPPAIQGIAALGVAIGFGLWLGRRFVLRLRIPPQPPQLYGTGQVAPLTDLEPVVDLVKQLDLLTQQVMKNEISNAAVAGQISVVAAHMDSLVTQIGRLADITTELLTGFRQEREDRADAEERTRIREEAKQEVLDELQRSPRRRPSRARVKKTVGG